MKPLDEVKGTRNLKWVTAGKLQSQLETAAGEVIATLTWKNRWSSIATGESSEGKWTFKRAGFLRPKVTIRIDGSDENVGDMEVDWNGGGDVKFASGSTFRFKRLGFWNPGLAVSDASGTQILSTTPNLSGREAVVKMETVVEDNRNRSLLAILSWYVIILSTESDSGGYMAAIVATM